MYRSPQSMSTRHLSTQESLHTCEKLAVIGKQWPGKPGVGGKKATEYHDFMNRDTGRASI